MKTQPATKQAQNRKKIPTFLKPSTNPTPIHFTPSQYSHPNSNGHINENSNGHVYNNTNSSITYTNTNTNTNTNANANVNNGNGNGNSCSGLGVGGVGYAGRDGKMVGDWDGSSGEKFGSVSNFNSYRVSIASCKNGKCFHST